MHINCWQGKRCFKKDGEKTQYPLLSNSDFLINYESITISCSLGVTSLFKTDIPCLRGAVRGLRIWFMEHALTPSPVNSLGNRAKARVQDPGTS